MARLSSYSDRVRVGDTVPLRVEDALHGPVEVVVVDAAGTEHALAVIGEFPLPLVIAISHYSTFCCDFSEGPGRGVHTCEYVPKSGGLHTINVFHNRIPIRGNPFPLRAVERRMFFF